MERQYFDIAIKVAHFLSFQTKGGFENLVIKKNQFIGIEKSKIKKIISLEEYENNKQHFEIKEWLDGSRHLLIPGLINAHTHLPMSLFRGVAEDAPLNEWLHQIIFPLEAGLADGEFCKTGALLSLLESIRFGTTTVGDMYFHEKAIAESVDLSGVRAVLGQAILDYPTPDNLTGGPDEALRMILDLHQEYKTHPLIQIACGPHAPYSCSDQTLLKVRDFTKLHQLSTLIHVSETAEEIKQSFLNFGKTPIERLKDLDFLNQSVSIAHGVHLNEKDIQILKQTGASIVHNPESNMKLGSGVAPLPKYFEQNIPVGLGTDGAASNNNLNLFHEMDSAVKLQKLNINHQKEMTAAHAFYMATLGGARSLGLDLITGTLEEGKEADLVMINLDHPQLFPQYDLASLLVYSMSGMEVETVMCAGKLLFHHNNFISLDREKILIMSEMQSKKVSSFIRNKI